MNVKSIIFLTDGNDRKKGERYLICSYSPTFHCLSCNFKQAVMGLVKDAGYKLVEMNEDCDALLCKKENYKGNRYTWRYVTVQ